MEGVAPSHLRSARIRDEEAASSDTILSHLAMERPGGAPQGNWPRQADSAVSRESRPAEMSPAMPARQSARSFWQVLAPKAAPVALLAGGLPRLSSAWCFWRTIGARGETAFSPLPYINRPPIINDPTAIIIANGHVVFASISLTSPRSGLSGLFFHNFTTCSQIFSRQNVVMHDFQLYFLCGLGV